MKILLMAACLFLARAAWAGSDFYQSDAGLGFEVPPGSHVIEREVFADSHSASLATVRVIKVLSQGMSEEASLGGHARAQVEVFEPTPWKDPSQWASSMGRQGSLKGRERWIQIGGQDALSLEILDAVGRVGSREVFLIGSRRCQGLFERPAATKAWRKVPRPA